MARVDFYILPEGSAVERFACNVTAKALGTGKRVHIHTLDDHAAGLMDDLLWTYRDISFVPHERYEGHIDDATPVTIGYGDNYPTEAEVMINLDTCIPGFATNFARIVEIVGGSEENKQQARERYRDYRTGPHQVHNHKIDNADLT